MPSATLKNRQATGNGTQAIAAPETNHRSFGIHSSTSITGSNVQTVAIHTTYKNRKTVQAFAAWHCCIDHTLNGITVVPSVGSFRLIVETVLTFAL